MKRIIDNIIHPTIPTSILMLVGCLCLWLPDFLMFTSEVSYWGLTFSSSWLSLVCFLLLVGNGFWFASLLFHLYITRVHSYFAIFVYVFCISCIPVFHIEPLLHVYMFIYIWLLRILVQMYKRQDAVFEAYNIGLLVSLMSCIYSPYLLLFPLVVVSMMLLHAFSMRTFLAVLLGMLTIIVLEAASHFLWCGDLRMLWMNLASDLSFDPRLFVWQDWIAYFVLAFWGLMVYLIQYAHLFAMSIRSRALLNVCLWNFVGLALLVVFMGNNPSYLSLGAVVVMVGLVQHFLQNYSALFRQISFVVLVGMMLVVYLFELYIRVYGVA